MTRIKYVKENDTLISPVFINYEGKRYRILIHTQKNHYTVTIRTTTGKIVEVVSCDELSKAKRTARNLIINKYNVRIKHEVRR
jgi:hypothetical protein